MKRFFAAIWVLCVAVVANAQVLDILNEDFDDITMAIPEGWDNSDHTLANAMYNWQYYVPGYGGEGKCLRFNSYTTAVGEHSALKTPVFALDRESMLSFKFRNADAGDFSVYLSVDSGKTYTNIIEENLRSSEWVEKEYSLAAYTGQTEVCIVFVATSNSGSGDAFVYLDDVKIEDIPLCATPKNLTLLSATDVSALLAWNVSTIGGEIAKYRLQTTYNSQLSTPGSQLSTDTVVFEAEDFLYELTGLTPNTEYKVTLEGYCGVGKGWSAMSEPLKFRTICSMVDVPLVATFDGVENGFLPECCIGENAAVSSDLTGSQLKLTATTTSGAMFVSPRINHSANDLDVKMKLYGKKGTKFIVGVMSDPTLGETFEPLWEDSITENNTWYDYRRPTILSEVYGDVDRVSLAVNLPSGVVATLYLDSIVVDDAPECMYPYDLRFVTSTANSVTVEWKTYLECEKYNVQVMADKSDKSDWSDWSDWYDKSDNKCTLNSLEPATNYKIRIQGVCGADSSDWTEWVDVRTQCVPRETAIFTESFAKGGVPECWSVKQTVGVNNTGVLNRGDKGWSVNTSKSNIYSGEAALWGRKAYAGIRTIAVAQAIDIAEAGMYDLAFWLKRLSLSGSDVLQVWVNNRPDTVEGVKLGVIHNAIDAEPVVPAAGWYRYEYNIPLEGVTYIIFEMVSNGVSQFYLDEMEVYLAPSCRKVKGVKWLESTTDGGVIEWTKGGKEEAWIVNAQCTMHNAQSPLDYCDTITGNPKWQFDGLTDGEDYKIEGTIEAYCGGEDKGEAVAFAFDFTTQCNAITEFPFVEGFEDERFVPKCWEQWQIASPDGVDSTEQGWGRNTTLTSYVHRGVASAQLFNHRDGHKHLLVMPPMNFGEGGYRLSFWQHRAYGYTIKQKEGVRVLINDRPTTEGAEELIYIKTNMIMAPEVFEAGFYKYKVDIHRTGVQYIMFEGVSEGYTSSFVDDIEVAKIPECDDMVPFAVVDVVDDMMRIECDDMGGNAWQVSYGEGNFLPDEGVIVDGEGSVLTIEGLTPSTTYRLYARRVCGDKYGAWSEELVECTTLCAPVAVRADSEWFEGFEDMAEGDLSDCYVQQYDNRNRELRVVATYNEMDAYGEQLMYSVQPKSGNRLVVTQEYNADNWLFAYVDLVAGENYELSVAARHGNPQSNISTKVSLAYGSRPMADSMTTYIVQDEVVDGDWTAVDGTFQVAESGKYFVGIHLQVNDYYEMGALDDIRLRVSNCVMPSLMSVSRTTQSMALLNVVSLSDEIRIVVSDRMFNPVGEQGNIYDATIENNGTAYAVNGLQPDTKYYYSVCGICGEYASDWMRVDSFETRCLAVDVPLVETFEDDGIDCWSVIGGGSGEVTYNEAFAGNNSYRANGVTMITPMLNVETLADYMLTGQVYAVGEEVAFAVGVMNDPNDIESFELLTTFTVHKRTSWTEFFLFFSALNDEAFANFRNAKYIAIVVPNDVDFYFDDLRIDEAVACSNPTEVVISNVTTSSVDLSWVSNGKENRWRVVAMTANGVAVDTVVDKYNITIGGLQPSMYYDFYVTALCSDIDKSVASYAGGARTLCCEVMPLPYYETMEGAKYESDLCFSYINKKAEYPAVELDKMLFVMGGKQGLELIMSKTEPLCLIMPEFEVPTNRLRISFDYRNETADTRWNTDLVLGVITDIEDISTFDTLRICPMSADSTRVYYYFDSLPDAQADARIAFMYGPGPINDRSCGIDNILIEEIPACIEPAKEMEIVAMTDTSVTIKFDGRGANEWECYVKEQGIGNKEQGTGEILTLNSQLSTLNSLEPRTYYDLYIRSVCDEDNKSEWVGPLSFRTNCKDGLETPWIENFEDYNNINESCFLVLGEEGKTNASVATGKYANKGEKGMLLSVGRYKELYVALPRFDAPLSDLKVVFDYYSEEHDGVTADLILGVMTDLNDKLTFRQVNAYGTSNGYVSTYQTFDALGAEYDDAYIVFKWCNFREEWSAGPTYYAYCGLDNIKVESKASCFAPENIKLVDVSDTSATFTWQHIEGITNAQYQVVRSDELGVRSDAQDPKSSPKLGEVPQAEGYVNSQLSTLNSLDPATDYVFRLRTMCNDTLYSDWVDYPFSTMPAPQAMPYSATFDDEEENNMWTLVNGSQMNKLVIGADAEAVFEGNQSLYVSHDGADYFYYFDYASDVHAYRPIYLEAGEYICEFDWKSEGEDTRDYGRIYLAPAAQEFVAGEYIAAQAYVPEGCLAIDGGIHLNENNGWQHKLVEFTVAESRYYNLVVSWHNNDASGATPPFAVDNIVVREATCLPVDSLQVVALTDRSATIFFKPQQPALEYEVQLVSDQSDLSDLSDNSQLSTLNSGLSTLNSLESATEYTLRIRAICAEGDTSQWRSISFVTEKTAVDAPYATGFEDAADNAGWTILNRGNNAFIVGPTDEAVASGDSALYVHSTQDSYSVSYNYVKNAGYDYNTQQIFAYRLIRFEPGSYYIDFDWKCEGKENEDFGLVSLQPTTHSGLSTQASQLLYGSLDWSRDGIVLQVEDTVIYKLMIMWQNEVDGTYYTGPKPLAIDNIEVRKLDCDVVNNIRLLSLGDTYAEVAFDNAAQATEYVLQCGNDTVQSGDVTETRIRLDGLTANTEYSLLLKALCDDDGESPARELRFTTTKYQYVLPYETGFENEDENARWSFAYGIGSNKFVINNDPDAVNKGERALYVSNGDSVYRYVDYVRNVAAYVSLTFDEPGEYVVNYDWKAKGEVQSDYARIFLAPTTVKLADDTRYPFDTLRSDFIVVDGGRGLCGDTAIWTNLTDEFVIDEPANYNLVVTWHNDQYINGTPPVAIDNIIVRKNSCKPVESVEILEVEDVRAKVKLGVRNEELGILFDYRVSLSYDVDEAFVSGTSADSIFTIEGLKPNATQYLFVRKKCSDADYSLWYRAEITTYCDDIITITKTQPYCDDFEYSEIDRCWLITKGKRTSGELSMLGSLETIVLKATNDVDMRLMRPFYLEAGRRYELSVKSRQRELLEDSRVGFVAGRRGGDYDTLAAHPVTQAYEVYDATFTPTESGVYELGVWIFTPWWCNNSTTYLLTIDNFEVREVLLAKPENFSADYVSASDAHLSWTGDGLADAYEVELLINGSVVRDTIVADSEVEFVGLKNSTLYDARVRGLLTTVGDSSSWAITSFRTHCDVVALPFREAFEECGDALPQCWTLASNLTEEMRDWAVKEEYNGNRVAQLSTSLANGYAVMRTPLLFVDSDIYSLSFRYETNISDDEYLVVRVSADAGYSFTDTVLYALRANAWSEVQYDLSAYAGKTIMVEWKVRSLRDNSYSEVVSIDDVNVVCRSATEIVYTDHICWGKHYSNYGFDVDTEKMQFGLNRIEQLRESQAEGECDTLKVLNLTIDPAGTFYLNDTICPGDVYNKGAFAGYNLTETGTYLSEPQVSFCGCDSTVRLYLVVQPKRKIINDTICEGDYYEFAGKHVIETGIYVDTISYCEFRILNLVVHPKYFEHSEIICDETSLEWEGLQLTKSGRYEKIFRNQYGCDSVEVMNLTVLPKYVTLDATICQGTTYYFGGIERSEVGVYTDSLVNILGCDSIVTLNLSISEPKSSRFNDYVCEGYEYVGYGFRIEDISADTLLSRTTKTIAGCDSIIEVWVDFIPTIVIDTTVAIVEGEYYEFGESMLTKPGRYKEVFPTAGTACDSIVNLTLIVETGLDGVYALPLVIAPNPVTGGETTYVNMNWTPTEQDGLRVEIIDARGDVVMNYEPSTYPIAVRGLTVRGIYFIRIVTGTDDIYVGKIIVN